MLFLQTSAWRCTTVQFDLLRSLLVLYAQTF